MKKKRIVSLLLSMIVCIAMMPVAVFATGGSTAVTPAAEPAGVWSEHVATEFGGGNGTEADPYKIATAEQLAKLAKDVNTGTDYSGEYFELTADIDLSGRLWIPIGLYRWIKNGSTDEKSFKGLLNGNNKTIIGLVVDEREDQYCAGLFGNIRNTEGDKEKLVGVKNLNISEAKIYVGGDKVETMSAGILAGFVMANEGYKVTFENVNVSGKIEGQNSDYDYYAVGGLAGNTSRVEVTNCHVENVSISGVNNGGGFVGLDNGSSFRNCTTSGEISGSWAIGGYVGMATSSTYQDAKDGSTYDHCYANMKTSGNNWRVGGFAGYAEYGFFNNCVATGNVESSVTRWEPKVGGFVGDDVYATIRKCHTTGKITATSNDYVAGGFVGSNSNGTNEGCSFDIEKNAGLKASGGASGVETANIAAETTQKVLSNICIDYYDGHNSITVSAKEATTTEEGWAEHSECSRCGAWLDSEGKEIEKELIPKKSSGGGYYKPVQKPEISAGEGGNTVLEDNGTTLVITPDEGMQVSKVTVNGNEVTVTDNKVTGLKTGDKVEITFTKIPPTKEELDKAFKEKAGEIELVARTSKTSKNNIKVTVKLTPALEAFIREIKSAGYTVKYKFYRSANKSSKYAARITKEEAEYLNTEGKKDKKYYYKAKLLIYDNEGNLVAQTELKQCKYGLRTWSK